MSDTPCLCGHPESEHFGDFTACDTCWCPCREYRPDLTIPLIDLETP